MTGGLYENTRLSDLWKQKYLYGTVIDVFIPNKKSKAGKRFAFVRFIKVFNLDRLVKNLCTIWIGSYHLFANQVRVKSFDSIHQVTIPSRGRGIPGMIHCPIWSLKLIRTLSVKNRVVWLEIEGVPLYAGLSKSCLKKPEEENFGNRVRLSHTPRGLASGIFDSSTKELNKEFSPTISAKVMNNSQVVHEDVSFNSVGGSGNNKGGSVLGVLDEMIRVGRAMGLWVNDKKIQSAGSKNSIVSELRDIDKRLDQNGPIDSLIFRRQDLMSNLNDLKEMEDMDFVQKAKVRWAIEDPILVKKAFKDHYEARFNKPTKARLKLSFSFPNRLSTDQVADLERHVSHDEIRLAVWDCGVNKSPGPDGFTFEFFRKFWKVIGPDFCEVS
ncbi:RNA-directed DNA polymerase, eukaryota [Tanacetum coccineum]